MFESSIVQNTSLTNNNNNIQVLSDTFDGIDIFQDIPFGHWRNSNRLPYKKINMVSICGVQLYDLR